MSTVVSIRIAGSDTDESRDRAHAAAAAVRWFAELERCCSRFDPNSELTALCRRPGSPQPVSTILFEIARAAIAVAATSFGAFDPTVGNRMEARGFDREYRTGNAVRTAGNASDAVSYRDVVLDEDAQTITLTRPLMLDFGAVAKGLAIDIAALELRKSWGLENFAIDAGGDLYLAGHNATGDPWAVGVRHPRAVDTLICTLWVSDAAVCTSGDYERRSPRDGEHHIIDPRCGRPATGAASVTVVAPQATLADALSTAAFVLGPVEGLALLERSSVDGLIITPTLDRFETTAFATYLPAAS